MPDHLRREPCLTALKSFTKCRKLIVCVLHLFSIQVYIKRIGTRQELGLSYEEITGICAVDEATEQLQP